MPRPTYPLRRQPGPPLPPREIEGTVTAGLGDVARLTWLVERGFVLAATNPANPGLTRAGNRLAAAAFWPLLPAAPLAQRIELNPNGVCSRNWSGDPER